ncbi:helix-turn-helix transcriptional regulator [Laribacter hongkongensis]|uniref:helix-turn-helix transcriptional regulator n=1 Tax=Laribacter hongkongensis TaxID=168471 RepID=UPI001EFCE1BD|nr:AlpA family phage regulatory protein [Laribacter hongkongensis]MCG9042138.1 AlpA family phage regulatory protein [Laribacter hongkongensis]MCG9066943.1 AlpA family phage regulatory protein [Laribacter hongkongensis]
MKNTLTIDRVLRRPAVEALLGKSRSWIYAVKDPKSRYFDPSFPQPIRLGRSIGWLSSELNEWIESRKNLRDHL